MLWRRSLSMTGDLACTLPDVDCCIGYSTTKCGHACVPDCLFQ